MSSSRPRGVAVADRPVDQHDIERLLQEDLLARLLGRYAADAPTANPRECGSCPHHRAAHTSWGCEYCSCGVSIVDLTGLGVLRV